MNKQNVIDTRKTKCPVCGVWVNNLRKHIARDRCQYQHIRLDKRRLLKLMKKWGGESIGLTPKKKRPVTIF